MCGEHRQDHRRLRALKGSGMASLWLHYRAVPRPSPLAHNLETATLLNTNNPNVYGTKL